MELRGLYGGKSCRESEKVMGGIKERDERAWWHWKQNVYIALYHLSGGVSAERKRNDFLLDGFAACCLCLIFHKQGTWGITFYDAMVSLIERHARLH